MYRVRKSWVQPDSQIGAYEEYKNALDAVNQNPGYKIFADDGILVYPIPADSTEVFRVRRTWANESSQVGAYSVYENAIDEANKRPGYSVFDSSGKVLYTSPAVSTAEVKTMFYKAKLLRNVGKHKKGETVTVTINRDKEWVMTDGTKVKQRSYMDLTKQLYDPDCKYSRDVAEAWVNNQGFKSETEYLFWANKWGQRVYIFKGSKKNWKLIKTCKCGTGSIKDGDGGDPGVYFGAKIYDKQKAFQGPRVVQYWNMHYSSPWGNSIHKGTVGKPSTHGCVALSESAAKWAFENLPLNTKVIVY